MKNLQARICKCGRIHFIKESEITAALEADKDLLVICGGCGIATRIGGDRQIDWNEPHGIIYNMYSIQMGEYSNFELTANDFETNDKKGIYKVLYSVGKQVMMETGYYARSYEHGNGRFEDIWYPDFWKIERSDITLEEVFKFIDDFRHERSTVNMRVLLNDLTEEEAEVLSHHLIKGLNWKGTKWENEFNSR